MISPECALRVGEVAFGNGIEGGKLCLPVLVQRLGLGQCGQFIEPLGLLRRKLAFFLVDAFKAVLLNEPPAEVIGVVHLDPLPPVALVALCHFCQPIRENRIENVGIIEQGFLCEKVAADPAPAA